ncbi:MAG: TIGR00159 family protein [Ruminococcaceae bacterium]|nr:TIGR00159 family protein [Oscillospiraceae bacterium]
MKLTDAIDIIIVAYIIYKLIRIVSGTKAAQIIKGIAFLLVITLVSDIFRLNTLNYILRNTIQVGLIALIILFQPELRKALENVGRNMFGNLIKSNDVDNADKTAETINQVCRAVHSLSAKKTGAIIVFERETNLEELLIGKYSPIDAQVTSAVLQNIFYPNTPLHDGAVIIRQNRIFAANCYLPLTGLESLDQELGTRHRAGIGITELSDCISVMVSEETGKISIATEGVIERELTSGLLELKLSELLTVSEPQTEVKTWLKGRVKGK